VQTPSGVQIVEDPGKEPQGDAVLSENQSDGTNNYVPVYQTNLNATDG
jgi:hypothetical protein